MTQPGPNFFCVGAPKAGTTWLYTHLARHPDIWLTPQKEMHFFDRMPSYPSPSTLAEANPWHRFFSPAGWHRHETMLRLLRIAKARLKNDRQTARFWWRMVFGRYDTEWYQRLFDQAVPIRGEITPAYSILDEEDVVAIQCSAPASKIVYMIRNPIDRAWSEIRYVASRGIAKFDISDPAAIVAMIEGDDVHTRIGQRRGDYLRVAELYGKTFGPDRILIGFYDAITEDPEGLLGAITAFLGVAPQPSGSTGLSRRINAAPPTTIPDPVRAALSDRYAEQMAALAERFGGYATRWMNDAGSGVLTPAVPLARPEQDTKS